MTEPLWPRTEAHPPEGVLLLALENGLDGAESVRVVKHLEECWDCRTRQEDLVRGIRAFTLVRREALRGAVVSTPVLPDLNSLPSPRSGDTKFFVWPRMSLRAATAAALPVIACGLFVYFSAVSPQKLTARDFFARIAVQTAKAPARQQVVTRRIQIRQGQKSFTRDISRPGYRAAETAWTSGLEDVPVDWSDPLDAGRYQHWHDTLRSPRDEVIETPSDLTLRTSPASSNPIRSASLTIRKEDSRPVAERFEFADRPALEIRELSFEVHESMPETTIAKLAPPPALPAAAIAPPPFVKRVADPAIADLERSEIRIREIFFAIGADKTDAPEVTREGSELVIRALPSTGERREQILSAISAVPHVRPGLQMPLAPTASLRPPSDTPGNYTEPPLAKQLWTWLGGLNKANDYLESVRLAYVGVVADLAPLRRLRARYSDRESLPADVLLRVDGLAATYEAAVRKSTAKYLDELAPVVDEMARQQNLSLQEGQVSGSCDAERLGSRIALMQTAFRRLFSIDVASSPTTLKADDLLRQVLELRSSVAADLGAACRL